MENYFDGISYVNASSIEKLMDLSDEEVNNLASGPQDAFFDKLEGINLEFGRTGLDELNVTDKWNWKPGTYDKMKEYLYKRMWLHKKTNGLDKLVVRTKERANYLGYIQRQIQDMEFERANLRRLGVSKDVDINLWKEKVEKFCTKMTELCENVDSKTEGKVKIILNISDLENRHPQLYYDITLEGLNMGIYSESNLIQSIPLKPINIIHRVSLRHKLSGMSQPSGRNYKMGVYDKIDENNISRFPYIASNRNEYGTVCFDKYTDDINKAINKDDLLSLAFILMQWAQYYNIKYSNPYNQPFYLHLGAPKEYSDEYIATQSKSAIMNNLADKINNEMPGDFNMYESNKYIVDSHDSINCRWKDEYIQYKNASVNLELLETERWFIYESIMHEIASKAEELYLDGEHLDDIKLYISNINSTGFIVYLCYDDEGQFSLSLMKKEIIRALSSHYLNHLLRGQEDFCLNTEHWLLRNDLCCDSVGVVINEEEDSISESEMMKAMKSWANSSEGGF